MIMEKVINTLSKLKENNVFYRNNLIDGSQPFYCRKKPAERREF